MLNAFNSYVYSNHYQLLKRADLTIISKDKELSISEEKKKWKTKKENEKIEIIKYTKRRVFDWSI